MVDRANEEELAQLMSIALDNLDVKPDSTATAPRTVSITRGRDGYAVRIGDGAGSPKSTKTNADQFFARGPQPYTLCSFFSVLCSCLSQPLAWLKFVLAFLYECVSWKCNCGSLWDFVLMGVVRRVTYAAQSANFTDRVTQAFIDLVPALDTVLDLLLGRGCSSCPVSTAVLAKGSDVGCGEWLWPKGAGRAGDTCPPLPSSTASPKTGAAVGDKIILYIHGGAFVLCNHSTHRLITYELVRRTGAVVLAPEYTRPPAAAYPVALDEMVSVYRKVVGFYDPANVIVAGDSAGGNLALTVTMKAIASGLPAPRALLLISPWCDLTAAALDAPSMAANAPTDYLPLPLIGHFADDYADGADASDPLISPGLAPSFDALPPAFVSYGTGESLMDQVEALVAALQRAGRLAGSHAADQMPHVSPLFAPLVYGPSAPAADGAADGALPPPPVAALDAIEAYVKSLWGAAEC